MTKHNEDAGIANILVDPRENPSDDDNTEPPLDPPISDIVFDPMPQSGPEVDSVREVIRTYESDLEKTKMLLQNTTTAYGYPIRCVDLDIGGKTYDNLLQEIGQEFASR